MPKIRFLPNSKESNTPSGKSVLEAAVRARIPLSHRCGGNGSCLTCKVIIKDQTSVSPPNEKELRMLGDSLLLEGFRLGCQCIVHGDADVTVPENPLKAAIRAQLARQQDED